MRLTHKTLKQAFLESGFSELQMSTARLITAYAEDDGIELRHALTCLRKYRYEVSVFVESILQPSDLDDVIYVIEMLSDDAKKVHFRAHESLRMLQAWRAKTMMQIVIDKRNADRLRGWVSEKWNLAYRAHNAGGLDVRVALELVRHQLSEVALIVEKILQPADLADVECVIEMLLEEDAKNRIWDRKCLLLLQSWRARMLMQIVIDKRNAIHAHKVYE